MWCLSVTGLSTSYCQSGMMPFCRTELISWYRYRGCKYLQFLSTVFVTLCFLYIVNQATFCLHVQKRALSVCVCTSGQMSASQGLSASFACVNGLTMALKYGMLLWDRPALQTNNVTQLLKQAKTYKKSLSSHSVKPQSHHTLSAFNIYMHTHKRSKNWNKQMAKKDLFYVWFINNSNMIYFSKPPIIKIYPLVLLYDSSVDWVMSPISPSWIHWNSLTSTPQFLPTAQGLEDLET